VIDFEANEDWGNKRESVIEAWNRRAE